MASNNQSDIIYKQIGVLTKKTIEFNEKIKSAQTRAKVNFYRKKMIKNNQHIEGLLILAQRMQEQEAKIVKEEAPEKAA